MNIKVGDVILDQFENTVIAQNFETNNFGDISTRNGGFSNDFTIPLTDKNEAALGFPSDLNIDNRKPYEKVDAQLIDVGSVVAIGYLRYKIVENSNEIKCSFFEGNTEWFNLIKDKNMIDLDLSDYDHIWNGANIAAKWAADPTSGYHYPLIDYGYFTSRSISGGAGGTTEIDESECFPGMFVSTLVEQIFKDIEWTVTGELLTEPRYQRMIQPFSAEDFVHSEEFVDDSLIEDTEDNTAALAGVSNVDVDWTDAGGATISISNNAAYNITVRLNVTQVGEGNGEIRIRKNGGDIKTQSFPVTGTVSEIVVSLDDPEVMVNGDIIRVNVAITSVISGSPSVTFDSGDITISVNPVVQPGDEVQMNATMPDMTQADFLKYIFFAFGIVPQPDNYAKEVSLDFFKTIEDNLPNALDWSDKIDKSKTLSTDFTQLLNNYSRVSIINYEEDEDDEELAAYKRETKRNFGQGKINIDNEHLDPEKEVYVSPYFPMININSFLNSVNIPQIKWFIPDPDNPGEFIKEFEPVAKIGLITQKIDWTELTIGVAPGITLTAAAGDIAVSKVPFCWFVKTPYTSSVDAFEYNLAFDQVAFPNVTDSTLKEEYIQDYEDVLNDMKYTKAFFKLNEIDINALNFLIPVYVEFFKSYFYINKIVNYQGDTKTTQVELIKISNG